MHVAFFSDQHPATLGGLQVSLSLQRAFLEAAGHTVTVCAPATTRAPSPQFARHSDVLMRARQVGEHSYSFAGPRMDRATDAAFLRSTPVDVVHIQADVWGAWHGYRFARRHGLPVVHTMHTNVEDGLPGAVRFPRAVFRLLYGQQQRHMQTGRVRDMGAYVRAFADAADALIVPSSHFASRIREYGIDRHIHIIPTGVDDRQISALLAEPRTPRRRPVLVWPGRISQEKRLDDLLHAWSRSQVDAELPIYGAGPHLPQCEELSEQLGLGSRVQFFGAVAHDAMLRAMRQADAVIQSSLGYETQGLTVYEALSLGTPVLVRDPNIARDLPARSFHTVANDSIAAFATGLRELIDLLAGNGFPGRGCGAPQFSQSVLTDQIIEVYRRVSAAKLGSSELEIIRPRFERLLRRPILSRVTYRSFGAP